MHTKEAQDVVYIDIETIAGDKPSLDDIAADGRLKDMDKIKADKEEKLDKAWRAQALDSIAGKIYCIGVACNDNPVQVLKGVDERDTMIMFDSFLYDLNSPKFVGHNIFDFDGVFLFHKGLKYRQKGVVYNFSDKSSMVDTMKLMDGPSFKRMVSQDKMTMLLQGKPGKSKYTGKDVHDLWINGQHEEILSYCGDDVSNLRDNYKILNSLGIF